MAKTPKRDGRQPRPGSEFPSGILGRNIRDLRYFRENMKQEELAGRMKSLGFSWFATTVGLVEKGLRTVSLDELFALALALETSVVKLLDPVGMAGNGAGIDVGLDFVIPGAHEARAFLLRRSDPFGIRADVGIVWEGNSPKTMFVRDTGDPNLNLDLFSDRAARAIQRYQEKKAGGETGKQ